VKAEAESQDLQPHKPTHISLLTYMAAHGLDTPLSYHNAVKGPQANEWHTAMEEEFDLLTKRGTWVLEYLPEGRKAIGCQWTYIIKMGLDGTILQYKACLVTQGFSQIPGINFNDTFTPTICLGTQRALLHLAAAHGWFRGQDDVDTLVVSISMKINQ
jgi:hypothetical protein